MGTQSTDEKRTELAVFTAAHFMHAHSAAPFSRAGWVFDLKYDGFRMMVAKQGDDVKLLTRRDRDATDWFPRIVEDLRHLPGGFVLDTEVCVVDENSVPDFEAMRSVIRARDQSRVVLYAFDVLAIGRRDLRGLPLLERKRRLKDLLARAPSGRIVFVDYLAERGEDLYAYALQLGMEGIVAKRADSMYVAGRSRDWLKIKPPGHHDGWKRPRRAATKAR